MSVELGLGVALLVLGLNVLLLAVTCRRILRRLRALEQRPRYNPPAGAVVTKEQADEVAVAVLRRMLDRVRQGPPW